MQKAETKVNSLNSDISDFFCYSDNHFLKHAILANQSIFAHVFKFINIVVSSTFKQQDLFYVFNLHVYLLLHLYLQPSVLLSHLLLQINGFRNGNLSISVLVEQPTT